MRTVMHMNKVWNQGMPGSGTVSVITPGKCQMGVFLSICSQGG